MTNDFQFLKLRIYEVNAFEKACRLSADASLSLEVASVVGHVGAFMELRRVLKFNGTLGMTLPNKFSRVLDLHWQDYVEIYLADKDTLVVRKHNSLERKELDYGKTEYPVAASA